MAEAMGTLKHDHTERERVALVLDSKLLKYICMVIVAF